MRYFKNCVEKEWKIEESKSHICTSCFDDIYSIFVNDKLSISKQTNNTTTSSRIIAISITPYVEKPRS